MQTIIGKEFPDKVIPLIDNAKQSIKIIVFDWRWYPNEPGNPVQLFNQAIIRAKRRGIDISVVSNVQDVVGILKQQNIKAVRPNIAKLIHTKMILIDDKILVIGSHNLTQSAFTMNFELSVIVESETTLDRFAKYFDNLFNTYG